MKNFLIALIFFILFSKILSGEEDLFFIAQRAFQEGHYQTSLSYLEKFLKTKPEKNLYLQAKILRGECYFYQEKYKEALEIFQEIFGLGESQPLGDSLYSQLIEDAHFKIIECLYKLGDYLKLKKNIDSYLTKFPETEKKDYLLLYKAEALFYQDKYLEAKDFYQKVIEISKDKRLNELAQLGLGFSYLRLDENSKAKDVFSQLIESAKDQDLIVQAYLGKAESLYNMDRYLESKEVYGQIKEMSSANKDLDRIYYGLGLCLLKEKNFFGAKEEFSKINSESLFYPEARYLKGLCLYNLREYKEAISIFEDALKNLKSEVIPKIEFYISDCLFRIGQEKEALSRFKNLRIKYPDSEIAVDVLYWLGDYYYKKKIFRIAKRYFNAIISSFPESKITPSSLYYSGKISLEEENYLQAKEFFLKAIKMNRDLEILILPDLALIYRNLGEFQMAISSLKKAIEINGSGKDYSHWQFLIGEIFQEQQRFDEAISEYSKVHPDSPYSTKALLRIAKIYEDKERWKEAEGIYRKILKLDIQEKKFAQERLEEIQKK